MSEAEDVKGANQRRTQVKGMSGWLDGDLG